MIILLACFLLICGILLYSKLNPNLPFPFFKKVLKISTDGKYIYRGNELFFVKGIAYGINYPGVPFPGSARLAACRIIRPASTAIAPKAPAPPAAASVAAFRDSRSAE